jgi:predicted nucleotidyltransferase
MMLAELLGSKSRARLIAALLLAPDKRLHLRALVRATGGSVASVQREIERLETMGLVSSARDAAGKRQVALVDDHPFAAPLAGMLAADPHAQYEVRSEAIPRLGADVDAMLASAVDTLVARFDPLKIVLFGSQASGTASAESDVDLLVVLPEVKDPAKEAVALRSALGPVGRGIDIVATDPEHAESARSRRVSTVRDALETGVTLYDRST